MHAGGKRPGIARSLGSREYPHTDYFHHGARRSESCRGIAVNQSHGSPTQTLQPGIATRSIAFCSRADWIGNWEMKSLVNRNRRESYEERMEYGGPNTK